MENNFFLNAGIQPPPPLHYEPQLSMPTWKPLSSAMEIQAMDFDSALSSMASSPAASNSNLSNESFLTGKSHQLNSSGLSRRATSFSYFGSQSFDGLNNGELQHRSSQSLGIGKIPRVSSSPALEGLGLGIQQNKNSPLFANSQQESTVSEQVPSGENGKEASTDLNSRKRKAVPRGKTKELAFSPLADAAKVSEADDNSNAKRFKPNEGNGNENSHIEEEEEQPKQSLNTDQKPPEPPKDFIHVRARRGQATDSHSLAERVRREKIGERMKLLQDLVPGCNKLTGKALMLDEIINYVQSLQRQVVALSMKLAFVDSRPDFNMDSLITKDMFQRNNNFPQPIFPIDSSAYAFCGHQLHQSPGPALHSNISNGTVSSLDPLDTALCRNLKYSEVVSQYPTFCEDDLQTIVQMGFGQNLNWENSIAITELLPL